MPSAITMQVLEMPQVGSIEDGAVVKIVCKGRDQSITLTFDPEQLYRWLGRIQSVTLQARIQRSATTGHLEVPVEAVEEATALAEVGGRRVVLALRTDSGWLQHYALLPNQADGLKDDLIAAIASARSQSSQTRQ